MGDGLTVVRSEYRPHHDLAEEAAQSGSGTALVATFALAGESGYMARKGPVLKFRAGRATLTAFASSAGERRFLAGVTARQLRLVFSAQALERYLGEDAAGRLVSGDGVAFLGERPIEPWCRVLLHPLLALEAMSPMDRQIAALTLAAEVLRPLSAGAVSASAGLDSTSVGKLTSARDLMHTHMDRRLTIPYLCMTVGLNEHAFKHGFRKLFGITPARYLLQLRMQRAWVLLESGARVSQTAYAVGYEHPTNFSAAFARYFGRTPKSFRGAGSDDADPESTSHLC
ncbi:MAG: AraC family transcriptional regulator [Azonexus sp.]|nr:AraC family transcriptional regulator [Azonexus sp.]MCK6413413.1 AraC family transcriptional regulator [Azonexus sp.]